MKQVRMELVMHTNEKIDIQKMVFYGFCFKINGSYIVFDFEGYTCDINVAHDRSDVTYTSWRDKCSVVDLYIAEDRYAEQGTFVVTREELTAKLLSSVTEVDDICIYIKNTDGASIKYPWVIDSITLMDEVGTEYPVAHSALDTYNGKSTS